MKDFSKYAGDREKANDKRASDDGGRINGSAFEMLKRVASKYEGASESELISAIMSEAKRSRANGSLSDADIDAFASAVAPMLGDKQRKQLEKVVEKIKKNPQ